MGKRIRRVKARETHGFRYNLITEGRSNQNKILHQDNYSASYNPRPMTHQSLRETLNSYFEKSTLFLVPIFVVIISCGMGYLFGHLGLTVLSMSLLRLLSTPSQLTGRAEIEIEKALTLWKHPLAIAITSVCYHHFSHRFKTQRHVDCSFPVDPVQGIGKKVPHYRLLKCTHCLAQKEDFQC